MSSANYYTQMLPAFSIMNLQWKSFDAKVQLAYNTNYTALPFTNHIRDLGIYHDYFVAGSRKLSETLPNRQNFNPFRPT